MKGGVSSGEKKLLGSPNVKWRVNKTGTQRTSFYVKTRLGYFYKYYLIKQLINSLRPSPFGGGCPIGLEGVILFVEFQ